MVLRGSHGHGAVCYGGGPNVYGVHCGGGVSTCLGESRRGGLWGATKGSWVVTLRSSCWRTGGFSHAGGLSDGPQWGGGRGGGGVFWSPLLHVCPPLPPGAMPLARSMSVSSLPGLEDWGGPPENAVLFEVAWEVANKGERPLPPPLPRPPVTPDPPVTPP